MAEIAELLEAPAAAAPPAERARDYLFAGEAVLEHWLTAHEREPTQSAVEGFRLLALHRQGAKGDPSFNACRETCRELVYHHNVILDVALAAPDNAEAASRVVMMRFVLNHLYLFVSGKLEEAGLGEFCCSARPLRTQSA